MPAILPTWEAVMGIAAQGQIGQTVLKAPLQNNQSKTDWRCGSGGRVPALQAQTPEYKP
jgi:hypothetical protein